MQQWEYMVCRWHINDLDDPNIYEKKLDAQGANGWELICCNSVGRMYELIFKRVKE